MLSQVLFFPLVFEVIFAYISFHCNCFCEANRKKETDKRHGFYDLFIVEAALKRSERGGGGRWDGGWWKC